MADDIPDNVRTLIASHINSVVQLELLLLLHATPDRARPAVDVGQELRIDPGWVLGQLQELVAAGLVVLTDGPAPAFRYWPSRPELQDAVQGLATAYAQRRVKIISLIFAAPPTDPIRSFTDAFRLRKDKDHG